MVLIEYIHYTMTIIKERKINNGNCYYLSSKRKEVTILVSICVYNTTLCGRKWVKRCTRFRSFAGRYSSAMCIWSRDETDTHREIWTSIILCYTHGNFTVELFKIRTILFGTEVFTLTGHWVIINIVFV